MENRAAAELKAPYNRVRRSEFERQKFAAFEGPGLDLRNSPDIFYALNADFSASASCMKSCMAFR